MPGTHGSRRCRLVGVRRKRWLVVVAWLGACASGDTVSTATSITGASMSGADGDPMSTGDAEATTVAGTSVATSVAESGSAGSGDGVVPGCGNGVVEGTEDCDGDDFNGNTCADYGFTEGVLACTAECTAITEACSTCGDGLVSLAEACDGMDFGGASCTSLGFAGGALACSADCATVDSSGCMALPTCGNGALDANEQCDGANLGGTTCQSLGFDMGTMTCTASCTLDSSNCAADPQTCIPEGDFCILNPNNPASGCCPPGVMGAVLGICALAVCV